MSRNITQAQIEGIVLDAAILFLDYGLATEREIGITKGGVEFKVTETLRQIDFDGKRGRTKGMEVVDQIDAYLKATSLVISNENILVSLGAASEAAGIISNTLGGAIPATKYFTNVTAFGVCNKTNTYKKITIKNAVGANGDTTIATADKSEAGISLQLNACWNPLDYTAKLYEITDATAIEAVTTLAALVVTSVAGATGKSVVTVASTPAAGRGFVYAVGATAETVTFDEVIGDWTTLISGATITPGAGNTIISVAEINGADNKAKAFGTHTLVVG